MIGKRFKRVGKFGASGTVRKFFCAFFITFFFSLSIFAQGAGDASGTYPDLINSSSPAFYDENDYDDYGNYKNDEPEPDLSQDYLAKSASPVEAVAWTRDGRYFATSWNNAIILWDASTNNIAAVYSNAITESANPLANVISLQFTSDGRYMLSVRDDNTAMIHSVGSASDTTLISGTGETAMQAATYAGDYRIILPLDGINLYETTKMAGAGKFFIEEKLDFSEGPFALSANSTGNRLLFTGESGTVRLIDLDNWSEITTYERFTLSRIKPKFAPDGAHFLAAVAQNRIAVTSIYDDSDFFTIENPAGFTFAADFSADSKKIVVGVNSSCVKIYDIESGAELNSFTLMAGDSAKSLAFSPDDEYVVIGTERGYIYRWVLNGEIFVPENERNGLNNALVLSLGYGRVGSDYYMGSGCFEVGYKNYFKPPFYWGANASFGVGIPGSEFPYTYYEGGESLSSPFVYTLESGGIAGLVYYNKKYDLHAFSEVGLGWNMRLLYNNSFRYPHSSKLYFGIYGEMIAGVQWKWARAWAGIQYDTNLHWLAKFHVGVAMPTKTFRKKKTTGN